MEDVYMCYNCGCGVPDDDMGSVDNITDSTLLKLAQKWKLQDTQAKEKLLEMLNGNGKEDEYVEEIFKKASNAWGQSESDAKRETQKLLTKKLTKN